MMLRKKHWLGVLLVSVWAVLASGCKLGDSTVEFRESYPGMNSATRALVSGEPVEGVVKDQEWRHFVIGVPEGSALLTSRLELTKWSRDEDGFASDVELFVAYGRKITLEMVNNEEEDCFTYVIGGNDRGEDCIFDNPLPGQWYFLIWGDDIPATFSLTVTVDGESYESSVSGLSSIVGVYDVSRTYSREVDEVYLVIDSQGALSRFDYQGRFGRNCYRTERNRSSLTHLSGNRFQYEFFDLEGNKTGGEQVFVEFYRGGLGYRGRGSDNVWLWGPRVNVDVSSLEAAEC